MSQRVKAHLYSICVYAKRPLGGSAERQSAGVNKRGDRREGSLISNDLFYFILLLTVPWTETSRRCL